MLMAAEGVHWGYEGDIGPENWAGLSPEFATCGSGVNQSPIDITRTFESDLNTIAVDHRAHANSMVNNGHTFQVNVDPGSWLHVGDESFQLIQIHFHSPSEHQINGELFPLEAHLVHADASGSLAVIGALYRAGEWNENLARIGAIAPAATNESVPLDLDLSDLELYDDHDAYYRYNGSLTTPPCTEGVRWFVLKDVGHIAQDQVDNFVNLIGEDARGPQPLNARIILEN
jgi:carbonic anhydrase